MTAIWTNQGGGWALLPPAGFPDEAALHTLIEQSPQLLPLAGSPRLTVLVVEVKLASNAEARRAVVAQVLTYAAYLHGLERAELERTVLAGQLQRRGYDGLLAAAAGDDQERSLDAEAFDQGL